MNSELILNIKRVNVTLSTTAAYNSRNSAKFLTRPLAATGYIYF